MNKVRRIFVGIDFSSGSGEALRQAHERALFLGARLVVCHVVPNELRSDPLFPHMSGIAALNVQTDLQRAGELTAALVRDITGRADGDFDVVIDEGTPYAALLTNAEKSLADLIVVGSHGATSANVFLGSVTNQIIRYAHCPVLLVRPNKADGPIVAGTDFSDPALPALEAAAGEARRTGSELLLVHSLDVIWPVASYPVMAFGGAPIDFPAEQIRQLELAAEKRLENALKELAVAGKTLVSRGPAGAALVGAALQLKARLIVVGTVGRTGLRRVLLGSVAERVANEAPCSVLIVRLHAT